MCDRHVSFLSRRRLLSAAAVGAVAAASAKPLSAVAADEAPRPNAIGPDSALARLLEGNARYVANAPANRDFSAGRAARTSAQHPIACIVGCADARVAPDFVFDQGPGDLFVVRVAGNFVNTDGLASLEYGVQVLGAPLILVLGHSDCGAVKATIDVMKTEATLPGHLPALIDAIRPAVDLAAKASARDPLAEAIAQNVRHAVRRLEQAGPILAERVATGQVKVVGGFYDIATGRVRLL
ncbi:carbonic anhydrase [Methylobacterium mesophilicum SR1.6/6]|uniref:Carbonic anhydrase n=1 Tax=Methylobacterium mesophilicum SR1.6/6 TaxID=908290 RepID=A0A6B9FKD7_9HYPH|nr:carbonic anhydrase [Methylobacterium mesophilicum]QGY01614.1 carbonic anhydrase [Methylobacterium mesophilicum SR1.6/6]